MATPLYSPPLHTDFCSSYIIHTHTHTHTHTQLVDCSPNLEHCGGTGGCEGSTAELAFKYSADSGVGPAMEVDYP
jgi:hypothetical protein